MNFSEPGSSPGPASRESTPGLNLKAKKQKTASDESDESESEFLQFVTTFSLLIFTLEDHFKS